MTEPLHALVRESVDVWNYDPVLFGFQQVGYISCGEENQISEYEKIHKSQNSVGYKSDLYVGQEARDFLTGVWPDFKHHTIDVVIHEKLSGGGDEEEGEVSEEDEELVEKCLEVMAQEKKASTSLFQRRLRLGYTRAARILDILEARGYVGPGEGAKPREILRMPDEI